MLCSCGFCDDTQIRSPFLGFCEVGVSLSVPGWCELVEREFDPSQSYLSPAQWSQDLRNSSRSQQTEVMQISEPLQRHFFWTPSVTTNTSSRSSQRFHIFIFLYTTRTKKIVCRRHSACQRCEVAVGIDVTVHLICRPYTRVALLLRKPADLLRFLSFLQRMRTRVLNVVHVLGHQRFQIR